jgi:hypothetical protein
MAGPIPSPARSGVKTLSRNRKNRKTHFCLFFSWNLLPFNLFQPKQVVKNFRIFRKIFGGAWGGGSSTLNLNPSVQKEANYEN